MLTTALMTAVPFVLSLRKKAKKVIDKINHKCDELGLPPAFEVGSVEDAQSLDEIYLRGNLDYQIEGLGIVVRWPPQLSFWVHYKKGSSEHQSLGRFLISLNALGDMTIRFLPLGALGKILDRIDDVHEVVQEIID